MWFEVLELAEELSLLVPSSEEVNSIHYCIGEASDFLAKHLHFPREQNRTAGTLDEAFLVPFVLDSVPVVVLQVKGK